MSLSTSSAGTPISRATTIIGSRFAIEPIHSMRPSATPSRHNCSAVSATNASAARIRLAANAGTNTLRWAACAGSSAVASTWVAPPSGSMSKEVTVPSGRYTIVAVRFDEKSSARAMTSSTASQRATT